MRILIGEDDILIAEHLNDIIASFGHEIVAMAHEKISIILAIKKHKPDLAFLDIRMEGKYDGIEIGEYILHNHHFPIIYITAHADFNLVKKALETKPGGYITKPFKPIDIYTALQIAVEKHRIETENAIITIKNGYENVKVPHYNILYLQSDNNYIEIVTLNRKFVIRCSLDKILQELNSNNFIRIHRSYVVNVQHVKKYKSEKLYVGEKELPISRKYKEKIKDFLDF